MVISHTHALAPEQARDRARKLVVGLEKELGAKGEWENDDRVRFKGKGFEGTVELAPGKVSVDVSLGLMLRAFASTIQQKVAERLKREFA